MAYLRDERVGRGGATDMYQASQTEQERKLSVFFAKMEELFASPS
jgi:hypothetical protein